MPWEGCVISSQSMRTAPFILSLSLLAITACSTNPKNVDQPTMSEGKLTVNTGATLSFQYPVAWGQLESQTTDVPSDKHYEFSALSEQQYSLDTRKGAVSITTQPFDGRAEWYESFCYDGPCSQEKSLVVPNGSINKQNVNVQWIDVYVAPSGFVVRTYRVVLGGYVVRIDATYDIAPLYSEKYDQEQRDGLSPSISALVQQDLGQDTNDPIRRLIALYPTQTADIAAFFQATDSMAQSMRVDR